MQEIQQLRKIAVKLGTSGTAIPIAETRLYKGGYGFVVLQCYVPNTQNRSPTTRPLCTVFRTTIDKFGNRKQFNNDVYNLLYVGDAEIESAKYMIFETPLPKAFTDTVGELEIVFTYSEVNADNQAVSRLASGICRTTVDDSDVSSGETVDPIGGELARLNDITVKVEQIEDGVDALMQSPDCTDADKVGTPNVSLTIDGRFKFSELKGEKGDTGELRVGLVKQVDYDEPLIIENSGTSTDAILDFEIPKGKPALVKIGKVTTLSPESAAQVVNVGTDNESVLDFYIPEGVGFRVDKTYPSVAAMNESFDADDVRMHGFVLIETGDVRDEDNAKLYIKTDTAYEYLTDLSGAQGIKGDTGITPNITAEAALTDEEPRVPSVAVSVSKTGAYSCENPRMDFELKNIVPRLNVVAQAGTNNVDEDLSVDTEFRRKGDTNDYDLTLTFNNIVGGLTKQALGLENINNTSDADKPVSAAMQAALDAKPSEDDAFEFDGGIIN